MDAQNRRQRLAALRNRRGPPPRQHARSTASSAPPPADVARRLPPFHPSIDVLPPLPPSPAIVSLSSSPRHCILSTSGEGSLHLTNLSSGSSDEYWLGKKGARSSLWDLELLEAPGTFPRYRFESRDITKPSLVAVSSFSSHLFVLELGTGRVQWEAYAGCTLFGLKFLYPYDVIVAGGGDGAVHAWKVSGMRSTDRVMHLQRGHSGIVRPLDYIPMVDDTKFYSSGNDGHVFAWDFVREGMVWGVGGKSVFGGAFSQMRKTVLALDHGLWGDVLFAAGDSGVAVGLDVRSGESTGISLLVDAVPRRPQFGRISRSGRIKSMFCRTYSSPYEIYLGASGGSIVTYDYRSPSAPLSVRHLTNREHTHNMYALIELNEDQYAMAVTDGTVRVANFENFELEEPEPELPESIFQVSDQPAYGLLSLGYQGRKDEIEEMRDEVLVEEERIGFLEEIHSREEGEEDGVVMVVGERVVVELVNERLFVWKWCFEGGFVS